MSERELIERLAAIYKDSDEAGTHVGEIVLEFRRLRHPTEEGDRE